MKRRRKEMREKIVVCVLGVFILLILMPSIPAIQQKSIGDGVNGDLPDLIVEDIYFYSRRPEWDYWELNVDIKNIGGGIANETATVKFVFLRLVLGILPVILLPVRTTGILSEILPGQTITRTIAYDYGIPHLSGIYIVIVAINTDKKLSESNYSNNWRLERRIKLGPYW